MAGRGQDRLVQGTNISTEETGWRRLSSPPEIRTPSHCTTWTWPGGCCWRPWGNSALLNTNKIELDLRNCKNFIGSAGFKLSVLLYSLKSIVMSGIVNKVLLIIHNFLIQFCDE